MEWTPLETRFWRKVRKTNDCWLWIGGNKGRTQHGVIQAGGRYGGLLLAHRVSWELHCGPIPVGMAVCHHCDNPACVRPDHLFLGTQAENIHDMDSKGRRRYVVRLGEDHGKSKLTEAQVREIRCLSGIGLTGVEIASRFGIVKNSVYNILTGKTWGHLS